MAARAAWSLFLLFSCFYCSCSAKYATMYCTDTGIITSFGGPFKLAPAEGILMLTGMTSEHDDYRGDRRWGTRFCGPLQSIHAVADCKQCGRKWCDASSWLLNEPSIEDYYIVAEPLKKLGCDKLPSDGTFAVRGRDSGRIYAFDATWEHDKIGAAPYTEEHELPATKFDEAWSRSCVKGDDGDQVVIGIESFHSNWHDDRSWKVTCAKLDTERFYLGECTDSGYVNDYDERFTFNCPKDGVVRKVYSHHEDKFEDRRWGFECCRLLVGPKPKKPRLVITALEDPWRFWSK